jgi:hypothetical protein
VPNKHPNLLMKTRCAHFTWTPGANTLDPQLTSLIIQLIPICTSNPQATLTATKATSDQLSEQNNPVDKTHKKHTTFLASGRTPIQN